MKEKQMGHAFQNGQEEHSRLRNVRAGGSGLELADHDYVVGRLFRINDFIDRFISLSLQYSRALDSHVSGSFRPFFYHIMAISLPSQAPMKMHPPSKRPKKISNFRSSWATTLKSSKCFWIKKVTRKVWAKNTGQCIKMMPFHYH